MTAKIIPINARIDDLWASYIELKKKAEASNEQADGIDAGRAWRRWLDAFMSEDQRQKLGGVR